MFDSAGGTCSSEFYHFKFPPELADHPAFSISHYEIANIFVALSLWVNAVRRHSVRVLCDNAASVICMQTGRARVPVMAPFTREIHHLAATNDVALIIQHCPGKNMSEADLLSRIHLPNSDGDILHVMQTQGKRRKNIPKSVQCKIDTIVAGTIRGLTVPTAP